MINITCRLDQITKEALIEELIRRTTNNSYELLMGKWNSVYINDKEYAIKIEERVK